jgi:hypothetical protein
MSYDDFVALEYQIYLTVTDDPMEYDDFVAGSNYLKVLFEEVK